MNTLQKIIGIIAFITLMAQTVRHAYVLWLEPNGSVLDVYDQPLKDQVLSARSLQDLVALYDPIHKKLDMEEKQTGEQAQNSFDPELRNSEASLRIAIHDWEEKTRELHSLWFYWAIAFCVLVGGLWVFRYSNQWFGIALEIFAFSEFIYWTSPSFFGGAKREFDKLLFNKLIFSVVSLGLLYYVARLQNVFTNGKTKKHARVTG